MAELVYKELSYKVVGLAFNVYNELGYGYREKIYQRAYAGELRESLLSFRREVPIQIKYRGKIIARNFIDFVIENKIAVEFKVANDFYTKDIKQLIGYLKSANLKLGILIIFTKDGIRYKRFVN